MRSRHKVTMVVPAFNEERNLEVLVQEVCKATTELKGWAAEVLFVDDGSVDRTIAVIDSLRQSGLPVGYVRFSRNFGHQAALEAGLCAATGDVVITMDADLQHPPAEIPRMLEAWEQGADVVHMVRKGGKGLFPDGPHGHCS